MSFLLPTFDQIDKIDNDYPDTRYFPYDGDQKKRRLNHEPKNGTLVLNEYWNAVVKPPTGNWNDYTDDLNAYRKFMHYPINDIIDSLTKDPQQKITITEFILNMKTREILNNPRDSLTDTVFRVPHQVTLTRGTILNEVFSRRYWNEARFWSVNYEKHIYQIMVQFMKSKDNSEPPTFKYIWVFSLA